MATRAECDERCTGRAEILAEVYASNRETLRRQAARHADEATDPDDVVHDACAEFLRYYVGEPGTAALRYLMVAVKHRAWAQRGSAASRLRSAVELTTTDSLLAGRPRMAVLCERRGPAELAESRERQRAQGAALAELKPDQRSALTLFAFGYSYREIATLRGWTRTKINRCLAEGRAALRRSTPADEAPPPPS